LLQWTGGGAAYFADVLRVPGITHRQAAADFIGRQGKLLLLSSKLIRHGILMGLTGRHFCQCPTDQHWVRNAALLLVVRRMCINSYMEPISFYTHAPGASCLSHDWWVYNSLHDGCNKGLKAAGQLYIWV